MDMLATLKKKPLVAAAVVVVVALLAWWAWNSLLDSGPGEGFVSGNGRIEATEIDVATKLPGRIEDILVREGDFVTAGQPLARMQLDTLDAQRAEAEAGPDAFDTEDEAVAIANDTAYGLTNYVQSQDGARRNRLARQLRAGMIEMNGESRGRGAAFGGVKASGRAREGGVWGLEEFMDSKQISGWDPNA